MSDPDETGPSRYRAKKRPRRTLAPDEGGVATAVEETPPPPDAPEDGAAAATEGVARSGASNEEADHATPSAETPAGCGAQDDAPAIQAALDAEAPQGDAVAEAQMGQPERRPTVLRTLKRDLLVKLPDAEIAATARQLAEAMEESEQEEADQAEQKAAMKERLTGLIAKQRRLATVLRRGVAERPVDVEVVADYEAGLAREIRTDTGDCVSSRHLTDGERQLPLDQVIPEHRVGNSMAVHSESAEAEKK